jgi:hypothetical protein
MSGLPGWENLIVCNTNCGFGDLITLVKAVMADLTIVATLFVTIAAVMIGFTLLTSQGNVGKKDAAKKMAWAVLTGYFFILIAWVLVYTISSALLAPGFSLLSGIK